MSLSDWDDMMPHSITVEPWSSQDAFGADSYGTAVSYRARVQGKTKLVVTLAGEEKVSTVQVYTGATVTARDRITLPAPFSPTQPSILAVAHVSDESGPHHTVVYA